MKNIIDKFHKLMEIKHDDIKYQKEYKNFIENRDEFHEKTKYEFFRRI